MKRILAGTILMAAAAQGVTVTPVATDEALINPGMGFMCYHMAGRMWAYGAPIPPGDTLDWFPGASVIYMRLPWCELEPEEGKFRWAVLRSFPGIKVIRMAGSLSV